MRYYPTFLNLRGRRCLIVGAGDVGCRKLASLLQAEPDQIVVLDTFARQDVRNPELARLLDSPAVHYEQRGFADADVQDKALVFACTGNRTVNAQVSRACDTHGVLCNVADSPDESGFIVPAHFETDGLVIALGTGGGSPALARRIRMDLQDYVGQRYSGLLAVMSRLRPLVLALGRDTGQNTLLFRTIVSSGLMDALCARDSAAARDILEDLLPVELHPNIGELLHELV